MLRATTFPSKLSPPLDSRSPSLSPRPMCVIVAVFIVSHRRIICSKGKSAVKVLTCSWRAVPSGVGAASRSSAETPQTRCRPSPRRSQGRGVEQGSVPRAAVTAWRRAACHSPQEMIRDEMSLTSSSTSLRRRADPTQPLLIPAWRTSRACSFARVDGGWYSARKREREREKKRARKLEGERLAVYSRLTVTVKCSQ